jgi:PAS domain S-box-containing protein
MPAKGRDLLGYEPEEVIGRTPFDMMPEEEAESVGVIFQNAMLQRKPLESLENISRCKDGELIILETNGVPFFDDYGRLLGYRGIDRDITERKRAEQALRARQELVVTLHPVLTCCALPIPWAFPPVEPRLKPHWDTVAERAGNSRIRSPGGPRATRAAISRLGPGSEF